MIRLLAALGVFLFAVLWFLGAGDDPTGSASRPEPVAQAASPAKRQVFIPALPVAGAQTAAARPAAATAEDQPLAETAPDVATASAQTVDLPATAPDAQDLPAEPDLTALTVKPMRVPGGATVHSGPGIQFPVLGMLQPGGVVMAAASGANGGSQAGWVRILVDGGGSGWVSAKLLRE